MQTTTSFSDLRQTSSAIRIGPSLKIILLLSGRRFPRCSVLFLSDSSCSWLREQTALSSNSFASTTPDPIRPLTTRPSFAGLISRSWVAFLPSTRLTSFLIIGTEPKSDVSWSTSCWLPRATSAIGFTFGRTSCVPRIGCKELQGKRASLTSPSSRTSSEQTSRMIISYVILSPRVVPSGRKAMVQSATISATGACPWTTWPTRSASSWEPAWNAPNAMITPSTGGLRSSSTRCLHLPMGWVTYAGKRERKT